MNFQFAGSFFYMLWLSSPKVISSDVKSSSTNQKLRKTTWEESANLYPLYLGRTVYRTSHIHIFIIEMKTEPTQMFAATTISSIHNRISNHFFGTNRIENKADNIWKILVCISAVSRMQACGWASEHELTVFIHNVFRNFLSCYVFLRERKKESHWC